MTKYIVTGGLPLHGTVTLHGAKNAGFKAMIASLLADTPSTISNLSLISEIGFAKQIISSLGGKVELPTDKHSLTVDPRGINNFEVPREFGSKSRSATMYTGPLLFRFGKAVLPVPGGDVSIARRPLDRHMDGLKALGAKVFFRNNAYYVEAPEGLTGTVYRFKKNTHTGTESLLISAVFAKGITVLENAAQEPEIDDLIGLLNKMGANVKRSAPRTIRIKGRNRFHGTTHKIMNDRIEAATFACAALATKGEVFVRGAEPKVLNAFLEEIKRIGGIAETKENGINFRWAKPLIASSVTTAPYPGFMTDWHPLWATLMTQAKGVSTIHETVFENRFGYVKDLEKMGGKFKLFNPPVANPEQTYNFNLEDDPGNNYHALKVFGPCQLHDSKIEINDLRRGATLLLAGIMCNGQTVINDPNDQIKRGYESLPEQLTSLGANIKVVSDV